MMFLLEKEMKNVIANNITNIKDQLSHASTDPTDAIVTYELPVKYRVIDVAIAYVMEGSLLKECEEIKLFKHMSSFLLNMLSLFYIYDDISIQKLKSELYVSWSEVVSGLEKLERLCLIKNISKYKYMATQWKISLNNINIVAIELKLCNWREALAQAEYNLLFSDYSFVAVDRQRIVNLDKIKAAYEDKNIGLLTVDTKGNIDIINIPTRNICYDRRMHAAQRVKLIKDIGDKWTAI